ncbi:CMRF35-like molecule 5 [Echinops telfairi]|uniref:CMRF35-like molecule 5 n=1 Tax=Echinops telfairi TaxID=9371 RepID=A0ABM0ZS11_ECHTE|nr:CMRF35-like molecule 5 [Echinops telfairi]
MAYFFGFGQETYIKWWCRGEASHSCRDLIRSTRSGEKVKKNRVSLRDNQSNHTFTVTMEKLREGDAGTYWCGIDRSGADDAISVQVSIDPGLDLLMSSALSEGSGAAVLSLLSNIHFLLLVFLKVPLFLSMLGAVLWVNRPQKVREGGGGS